MQSAPFIHMDAVNQTESIYQSSYVNYTMHLSFRFEHQLVTINSIIVKYTIDHMYTRYSNYTTPG